MAPARIHIELATKNRLGAQLKDNRGRVPEVANGVRIIRSGTRPRRFESCPFRRPNDRVWTSSRLAEHSCS